MEGVGAQAVSDEGANVAPREEVEEPACKPDPVPGTEVPAAAISLGAQAVSRRAAASRFTRAVRPTRQLGRAALERCLLGLAPGGACRAGAVARAAGALLPHRFTLTPPPRKSKRGAVCFLLRLREVAPAWVTPAPCPAESGLSSTARCATAAARPAPPPLAYVYRSPASHRSTPMFARASAAVFCSRGTCSNEIRSNPAARLRARRWSGWRCSLFTRNRPVSWLIRSRLSERSVTVFAPSSAAQREPLDHGRVLGHVVRRLADALRDLPEDGAALVGDLRADAGGPGVPARGPVAGDDQVTRIRRQCSHLFGPSTRFNRST